MAGRSNSSYIRFAVYDMTGALIWSGAYVAVGYGFSGELKTVVDVRRSERLLLLPIALSVVLVAR